MRVYIESTIPSYLVARPPRDLLQAARQQVTRDWWDFKRQEHDLFTSQIALDEIRRGEAEMARQRETILGGIPILAVTEQSRVLTRRIVASRVLPLGAEADAGQIALATIYKMEVLLTWNLRHIANAAIQVPLRKIAAESGLTLPELCTPEELTGELYEEPDEDN